MSRYETLEFWIRIDSNRDEVADDHTPIGLVIWSHGAKRSLYEKTVDLGGQQRAWIPAALLRAGDDGGGRRRRGAVEVDQPRATLSSPSSNYAHGTRLVFDVGEALAPAACKEPTLVGLDAPRHVLLPRRSWP